MRIPRPDGQTPSGANSFIQQQRKLDSVPLEISTREKFEYQRDARDTSGPPSEPQSIELFRFAGGSRDSN
jgi:hypothetical protein